MDVKTGSAWAIKESLREFWKLPLREEILAHRGQWYWCVARSRLKLAYGLTYFTCRIANALLAEGLSYEIQKIKKAASGLRSFENFKTAIIFHCGGLQFNPVTHAIPG